MKARTRQSVGIAGVGGMIALMLATAAPAGAKPAAASVKAGAVSGAVPFGQANFSGYASGDLLHVGALSLGSTNVADVEQAFSGASTSTNGLAGPIVGDNAGAPGSGLLVQPAQSSSVHAYGTGAGLEAGLLAPADASGDQLKLAGKAEQIAPPNGPAVTTSLPSAGGLNLGGLLQAGLLTGRGAALYDPTSCPIGQPLSYGVGDAASLTVLPTGTGGSALPGLPLLGTLGNLLPGLIPGLTSGNLSGGLITTNGNSTSALQTDSETYLSPNGDGTFGLTTSARETVAPITINLLGLAQIILTVGGTSPNDPITLSAKATGESSGASVSVSNNAIVRLQLVIAGQSIDLLPPTSLSDIFAGGGLTIPLDLAHLGTTIQTEVNNLGAQVTAIPALGPLLGPLITTLTNAIQPVTTLVTNLINTVGAVLPNVSLGYITIGQPPRAINGSPVASPRTTPTQTGGTAASGAFDLARIHLGLTVGSAASGGVALPGGLSSLTLADVNLGHLEASSTLAAPITCNLPIVKTANPSTLTAGNQFIYTIQVPDPAKLGLLSCNLSNVNVTDTISDLQGNPTFTIVGVSNGGTVTQTSPTSATVNWSNLSYTAAPVGAPPAPPITLTITVSTPSSSPSGVIQDMVNAIGTTNGCNGGVSGIANLGGTNGAQLAGAFTLQQPGVTSIATPQPGNPGPQAPGPQAQGALPHTGGTGGLWQPLAGVVVLGMGGAALTLVRRSRRRLI